MIISDKNEKTIGDSIDKLSQFLDSDAYMEMVNNIDTPPDVRKFLNTCWTKRNSLVRQLLKLYAKDLSENNNEFRKMIAEMEKVRKEAQKASDGLKKIADRIEAAVQMANAVDSVLRIVTSMAA